LEKVAVLGQLFDRIPAIEQDSFIAVDVGDLGLAAAGRGVTGIVGEHPGLGVELADVDHCRTDRAVVDRKTGLLAAGDEFAGFDVGARLRIHDRALGCLARRIVLPRSGGMACATCFRTPRGKPLFCVAHPSVHCKTAAPAQARCAALPRDDVEIAAPCRQSVFCSHGEWSGLWRLAMPAAAWSCRRARLSLFPNTANTSKIGGEVLRPVSAARNGCATVPSLTPLRSAKARTACSVVSALQGSTILRSAERSPRRLRASAVSRPAALLSGTSGRLAAMKRAPSASSTRVLARSFSPAMAASSFLRISGVNLAASSGPQAMCGSTRSSSARRSASAVWRK